MTYTPRIAILGAGPSGLSLALLLLKSSLRPTVYDLRPSPSPEILSQPSGMLDLHTSSGLRVIRSCDLDAAFAACADDCTEATRILSPRGDVLHVDDGDFGIFSESRPEIARNALARIMLGALPGDVIHWESKVTSLSQTINPQTKTVETTVRFADGTTATYDFVVGADGAWSRARTFLSDTKPAYSGAHMLAATIQHASTRHPELVELVGSGTMFALGHTHGITTHRGPADSILVAACVSSPDENWAQTNRFQDKTAVEVGEVLLSKGDVFHDWGDDLKGLLRTACEEQTRDYPDVKANILSLYELPVGFKWEHRTGVTLVGDAAHLMTPWAGEGVNLALWDSLDLAKALGGIGKVKDAAAWQAAVDVRVRKYEKTMWARSREKAEETARNKKMLLSENGGEAMAKMFRMFTLKGIVSYAVDVVRGRFRGLSSPPHKG